MSKNVLVMILGVVMLTIISACSGSAQKKAMKENLAVIGNSKPVMVTKSGSDNRPSWCNESRFQETDTGFLFSGGFMGGADYALTTVICFCPISARKINNLNYLLDKSLRIRYTNPHLSIHAGGNCAEAVGDFRSSCATQ